MQIKPCPRCNTVLSEAAIGDIRVDGCTTCGGVWFDDHELTSVVYQHAAELPELESRFHSGGAGWQRKEQGLTCPVCDSPLVQFQFKHTPGIPVNGCPGCKGLWLDDGELAAIDERVRGCAPAPARTQPRQDPRVAARQALGFLRHVLCTQCGESNPAAALVCWACGASLKGVRGLLCPRCDRPLQTVEHEGVYVDTCGCCGGLWLDCGELPSLLQRSGRELQGFSAGRPSVSPPPFAPLVCPVCHVAMEETPFAHSSGVYINACGSCRGVWTDSGELAAIADVCARDPEFFQPS